MRNNCTYIEDGLRFPLKSERRVIGDLGGARVPVTGQEVEPQPLGGKQPPSYLWQVFTETQPVNFRTGLASFSTVLKHCTSTDFKELHITPNAT